MKPPPPNSDLRISQLLVAFFVFAEQYYRKDGRPTGELPNLKEAARQLVALYATERVSDFGPLKLKIIRQAMIDSGLSRKVINSRVNRVRRIFKWGLENELVEPTVLQALQAIAPLKQGHSAARETHGVRPVPDEDLEAVLGIVGPSSLRFVPRDRGLSHAIAGRTMSFRVTMVPLAAAGDQSTRTGSTMGTC